MDPSLGLHTRAGYRFHPHFAGEAHYEWASGFDVSAFGVDALTETIALTFDVSYVVPTDDLDDLNYARSAGV